MARGDPPQHVPVGQKIVLEPRHEYRHDLGWCRNAIVDGITYCVGIERGRRVRIAFKPKGQNMGWTYYGFVRNAQGKEIWGSKVGGSLGAKGLLLRAGIVCPVDEVGVEGES